LTAKGAKITKLNPWTGAARKAEMWNPILVGKSVSLPLRTPKINSAPGFRVFGIFGGDRIGRAPSAFSAFK
jgi:hypothetical protein